MDTAEGVTNILRPYWSEATRDRANVVQAVPDMLEIVPRGTSKGNGVKILLEHLGISTKEVKVLLLVCYVSLKLALRNSVILYIFFPFLKVLSSNGYCFDN